MGKTINIKGTEDSPKVVLNKEKKEFEISGRSLPEDAEKFYTPIYSWIENYVKDPLSNTEFKFNLEYFNSSSVKQIVKILIRLEQIAKAGKSVRITWLYDIDDELIKLKGEEIKAILNIPLELKINDSN